MSPNNAGCYATGELVTVFCDKWNQLIGDEIGWRPV